MHISVFTQTRVLQKVMEGTYYKKIWFFASKWTCLLFFIFPTAFFKKIYLFERQNYWKQRDLPSCFVPDWLQWPELTQFKATSQKLCLGLPHGCMSQRTWTIFRRFPRHRELAGTCIPVGFSSAGGGSTHCATIPTPPRTFWSNFF